MMLALLFAIASAADVSAGQPRITHSRVERVAITADHAGWHSRHQTLTITRTGASFSDGTRTIEGRALDALLAALSSPQIAAIELDRLGLDQATLRTAAEDAATRLYPRALVDDVVARFMASDVIAQRIEALDGSGPLRATDDDPSVRVEVTLKSGEVVVATSRSQQPLMLPWKVERHDQPFETLNADISRRIADLLPEGFVERDRVAGTYVAEFVAQGVTKIVPRPAPPPLGDDSARPDFIVAPSTARFSVSPRMFEDGSLKLQATVKNNTNQPITIDITPGSLAVRLWCNDRGGVSPHAGTPTITTPSARPRDLAPHESVSFEIPGLFTWANEAHTRALLYEPIAGACRVTFSTWYRLGSAPPTAARRIESNIVTLELADAAKGAP